MDADKDIGGVVGGSPAPATAVVAAEGGFSPGAEVVGHGSRGSVNGGRTPIAEFNAGIVAPGAEINHQKIAKDGKQSSDEHDDFISEPQKKKTKPPDQQLKESGQQSWDDEDDFISKPPKKSKKTPFKQAKKRKTQSKASRKPTSKHGVSGTQSSDPDEDFIQKPPKKKTQQPAANGPAYMARTVDLDHGAQLATVAATRAVMEPDLDHRDEAEADVIAAADVVAPGRGGINKAASSPVIDGDFEPREEVAAAVIAAPEGEFAPGAEVADILYIRTARGTVIDRIFDDTGDLITFRFMEGDAPSVAPNLAIRRVLVPREVDYTNLYIVNPLDEQLEITTRAEFEALSILQRQQGATVAVRQESKRKKHNLPMKEPIHKDSVNGSKDSHIDGEEELKRKRPKKQVQHASQQPQTSNGDGIKRGRKRKSKQTDPAPAQQQGSTTGVGRQRKHKRNLNDTNQTPAQQGASLGEDPPDDFIPPHYQVLLDIENLTEQKTREDLQQMLDDADSKKDVARLVWRKCVKRSPICTRFGKWHYVLNVGPIKNKPGKTLFKHLSQEVYNRRRCVISGRNKQTQKKYSAKPNIYAKQLTKKQTIYANNPTVKEKKLKYMKEMGKNVFYLSVSIKKELIEGKTAKEVWELLQDPEATAKFKPRWYFGKYLQTELDITMRKSHAYPNTKSPIKDSYIDNCRIFECLANAKTDDDEASTVESFYIHHLFALKDTDPDYIALNKSYGKRIHSELVKKALANGKSKIPFVKFTNDEANTNAQFKPPFVIRSTDFKERTEWFKDIPRTKSTTPGVKSTEELENNSDSEHYVFYLAVCIEERIIEGKTEEEVWEMLRSKPSAIMRPRWYFGIHIEIEDGNPTMRRSHVYQESSPIRKSYIEKFRVFECIASIKKDKNEASTVESFFYSYDICYKGQGS